MVHKTNELPRFAGYQSKAGDSSCPKCYRDYLDSWPTLICEQCGSKTEPVIARLHSQE